jgi:solute carrier family 45 protein 1/2/4
LFGLTSTLGTTEIFGKDSMGARTKFVAFQGINWAITCWVPFGLVMEYIKQDEEEETDQDQDQPLPLPPTLPTEAPATAPSTPRSSETSPLLSSNEVLVARSRTTTTRRGRGSRGGTILGIHNLSIVLPQFFVAIFSAIILKITSSSSSTSGGDVVWVLRFGGLASLIGAFFSRWVFETKSEREYVDRVLYGPSV